MALSLFFLFFLSLQFTQISQTQANEVRQQIVYTIAHELSMGRKNKYIRKDYYISIGENQGVVAGTVLDVYRIISKNNPYENNKTLSYKIPIATIKVIHAEKNTAIARMERMLPIEQMPIQEVSGVMIGDFVGVHTNY